MSLPLMLIALAGFQPLLERQAWASFGRDLPGRGDRIVIRVGVEPAAGRGEGPARHHWFERRMQRFTGFVAWARTDTRACPAAMPVLRRMGRIALPAYRTPGAEEGPVALATGPTAYFIEADAYYAAGQRTRMRLESNRGTAAAEWVDEMLAALDDCWREDGGG